MPDPVIAVLCALPSFVLTQADPASIKNVHLIFMNHLDVGYSLPKQPGYLVSVLNTYFTQYFPRAITVSLQMLGYGYRERFIYTTHPWLVDMYIHCPPNLQLAGIKLQCPDSRSLGQFESAVARGDITWHAGPMNMQLEMLDPSLAEFSVQLSIDLDKRFNITRKHRTLSQRDVPGTTQTMIPILEKLGIEAISVGVNSATAPPAVPPIFNWKYKNSSIIALWHPGGYPEKYGPLPFIPGGLSSKDCATFPGMTDALCFAFRNDNDGPPVDYKEVLAAYEVARGQFPNAMVRASTFENFTNILQSVKTELPVLEKEIGDVWIQGVASDPRKVAEMRAVFKALSNCRKTGECTLSDPRVYNASRFLIKLAEHTWGLSGGNVDNIHWTNDEFYRLLLNKTSSFANITHAWWAQRYFTALAMEALGNHSLVARIKEQLQELTPARPNLHGYKELEDPSSVIQCAKFHLQFNKQGALVQLTDPKGINWASSSNPLGEFAYQTYNQTDFDAFNNATTPYSKHYFLGIGKPNMTKNADAESKIWDTQVIGLYTSQDSCSIIVNIQMKDDRTWYYYGAPKDMWIIYNISPNSNTPKIDVEVQWYSKVATRLPESISFSFIPVLKSGYKWLLSKVGNVVDPLNVVQNGSQRLHAIDEGIWYVNNKMSGIQLTSQDASLVNILTPDYGLSVIPTPLAPIQSITGVAFNMFNNVWETNYIFWYPYVAQDTNQKFRFTLNFL